MMLVKHARSLDSHEDAPIRPKLRSRSLRRVEKRTWRQDADEALRHEEEDS